VKFDLSQFFRGWYECAGNRWGCVFVISTPMACEPAGAPTRGIDPTWLEPLPPTTKIGPRPAWFPAEPVR
jgi:hypothetical protein